MFTLRCSGAMAAALVLGLSACTARPPAKASQPTDHGNAETTAPSDVGSTDPVPPVRNFGDWWPATQFNEDSSVSATEVQLASLVFDWIHYGSIPTPWGYASASLKPMDNADGLRFDIVWSGPGTMDDEGWSNHKSAQPGDVAAAITSGDDVIAAPTNGEPQIMAWAGGGLGTSGDMMIAFDWTPTKLDDYWVRVTIVEKTHWFLIPYGLGCDLNKAVRLKAVEGDGPTKPPLAKDNDQIHNWQSIEYDFGEVPNAGCRLKARIRNANSPAVDLTLYRETEPWNLQSPRTSVAFLRPEAYPRFGHLKELSLPDHYRRADSFHFGITPHDLRGWAMLRITIEEAVVQVAVPTSLFHYWHGTAKGD